MLSNNTIKIVRYSSIVLTFTFHKGNWGEFLSILFYLFSQLYVFITQA